MKDAVSGVDLNEVAKNAIADFHETYQEASDNVLRMRRLFDLLLSCQDAETQVDFDSIDVNILLNALKTLDRHIKREREKQRGGLE